MSIYKFSRKQLKTKSGRQFKTSDVIKTDKYYIHINSITYKTRVNTEQSMIDMKPNAWPKYIKEFVFRLIEEL